MKRLPGFLLWSLLFLALLLGIDQFFLRVPLKNSGYAAVREFYLDFRTRLLHLQDPGRGVTKKPEVPKAKKQVKASKIQLPPEGSPRYFYVDEKGELQFADTLEEIPPALRREARRLEY